MIFIFIGTVGFTYGYFKAEFSYKSDELNVTTGTLKIDYVDNSPLIYKPNFKPGDVIRYLSGSSRHSIIVLSVSGNIITYLDCNSGESCRINWDLTMTIDSDFLDSIVNIRAADYEWC